MKRYKTGLYDIYDQKYLQLKNASSILSGAERMPNAHSILWDKNNLEGAVIEYTGDAKGYYKRNGETYIALIPGIKSRLKELERKFNAYQKEQLDLGYESPADMPPEMLDNKLLLEARLDVLTEELTKIEAELKIMQDDEKRVSADLVLKYGLKQHCKLIGGVIARIDGQNCAKTEDGIIIIQDDRSPYNGMSVSSYRQLASKWELSEKQKDAEILALMQKKARAEGQPIPNSYNTSGRVVNKAELPAWPQSTKNYLS